MESKGLEESRMGGRGYEVTMSPLAIILLW